MRGILTVYSHQPNYTGIVKATGSLVLTEVPASSIAAMFGYPRRYQKTPFIRLSLSKHLRRYFLLLDQLVIDLSVKGVFRQFRALFRALNTPLNQLIKNPLSGALIPDFSIQTSQLGQYKNPSAAADVIRSKVSTLLQDSLTGGTLPDTKAWLSAEPNLEVLLVELTNFFLTQASKPSLDSGRNIHTIYRYSLVWEHIFFQKINEHGFRRRKRARSIKKRRTKRLVKKTKYRFWAL